jgi:hypothetical protein
MMAGMSSAVVALLFSFCMALPSLPSAACQFAGAWATGIPAARDCSDIMTPPLHYRDRTGALAGPWRESAAVAPGLAAGRAARAQAGAISAKSVALPARS